MTCCFMQIRMTWKWCVAPIRTAVSGHGSTSPACTLTTSQLVIGGAPMSVERPDGPFSATAGKFCRVRSSSVPIMTAQMAHSST